MKKQPAITVLICAYNAEATIVKAITNSIVQTLEPSKYELIVIDDGSTDNTGKLIDSMLPKLRGIRFLQLAPNWGLVDACNFGIKQAAGEYLVRVDADDYITIDCLSELYEKMINDDADLVVSDRIEVDEGRHTIIDVNPLDLFTFTAAGVLMRTDILRKIGGYRKFFWEEYDLYIRYLEESTKPASYVQKPLYYYRRHPGGMTANADAVKKGREELRQEWGDIVPISRDLPIQGR